jgi:hypothetical protein
MATIKSFTDLQQSKKLAEFLPLESADMWWNFYSVTTDDTTPQIIHIDTPWVGTFNWNNEPDNIPCWSLASLLEQLPYELCDDDGNSSYLQINKEDDVYQLVYEDPYGDFESIETDRYEHFINACYEMILKLHELEIL